MNHRIQPDLKEKIRELIDRATAVRVSNVLHSIDLANEALELSREIDDEILIAQALSKLSLFYMIIGKNELCTSTALEAIDLFEKLGDEKGIADAKYSIAGTYYKTDQFYLGLMYLGECITLYKKHNDHFNLARTYKSMGTIYEYFGDVGGAVQAYEQSIVSAKIIGDTNLISNVYNPLSGIYLNEGRTQEAMALIAEAIVMKQATGDVRGLAFSLYGRGKVYAKMGENNLSEQDFLESIRIHQEMNENLGEAMALRKLGLLFVQKKEFDRARELADKVLEISGGYNMALPKVDALHLRYVIARDQGLAEQSLKHLEEYLIVKDQLVNERSREMIKSFEVVSRLQALELETQAQRERNEIIEKKNQELDAFFHRVSHDLKGPISSLVSIDAMLRRELKDQNILNFLDLSISQVHRINKILDELIILTRVTHSEARKQLIDFTKIMDDIFSSLENHSNYHRVRVERKVEKQLAFRSHWVLINTILQNLLENAIKYARLDQRQPLVKITIQSAKKHVIIVVSDNGTGMSAEEAKQAFDMFYRANRQVEGSGLGLYILKRAVEKLGGTVALETKQQQGSVFTITLPA